MDDYIEDVKNIEGISLGDEDSRLVDVDDLGQDV